jgi:hypothetical protein
MALSSRAFAKSSNKGGEKDYKPTTKGYATGVVSPVTLLLNAHILVKVTGTKTRRGRRRRRNTTRRRAARHT